MYIKIKLNYELNHIFLEADYINLQYNKLNLYKNNKLYETFNIKDVTFFFISKKKITI